jgi:hypothetical protein
LRTVVVAVVVVSFVVVVVAFIEDDEVVSVAGVGATPVEVVVAVLGLALMEPVALVDVSVPVVALGLVDSVLVAGLRLMLVPASVVPVVVEVEVLPVAPGLAEPVPPCDVPVAEVPLEPVPPLCARATPPATPMMQRAAVAKVDLTFMCVSC